MDHCILLSSYSLLRKLNLDNVEIVDQLPRSAFGPVKMLSDLNFLFGLTFDGMVKTLRAQPYLASDLLDKSISMFYPLNFKVTD